MRGLLRRRWVHAGVAVGVVALAVALWAFEPWRLWTRSTVDEALPSGAPAVAAQPSSAASPAAAPVDPGPRELGGGRFVSQEHPTTGTARLLELGDGSRVLRLEGFGTSDGPDLHVWLTDADAGGEWGKYDDGRTVRLGELTATDGNQNYPLPPGVSLDGLRSAVIWCDRFNVAFGSAPLSI